MKGKSLQLVGIIIYVILSVMSVIGILVQTGSQTSVSPLWDLFKYVLLFQSGVVLLVINHFKTTNITLFSLILATFIRILCAGPIFFVAAFIGAAGGSYIAYTFIYIEIVAKILLGLYNIIITIYVLSKKEILKNLVKKIKANENVSVISKYIKEQNSNTITLVYKTIDKIAIANLEESLQAIDSHYKINVINIDDIKDEEKSDDIMLNSKNLYNDGRVESPHY